MPTEAMFYRLCNCGPIVFAVIGWFTRLRIYDSYDEFWSYILLMFIWMFISFGLLF
jgi:hypothetical protein